MMTTQKKVNANEKGRKKDRKRRRITSKIKFTNFNKNTKKRYKENKIRKFENNKK